jgi:glycosyltransferase involved in cell wall biosynthesis
VRVLIAIPVHNEKKYVNSVLEQVKRFHSDILVIDDGSTDGTTQLLAARSDIQVITHPTNLGYGQSLIDAFRFADNAGFDWVITMDCDEQHEPAMIPTFIREIRRNDADLISGSRYLESRPDDDAPPSDRRKINATLTAKVNELFDLHLTDAFCGFKAHRVCAMRKLTLDVAGYAFPMQLWPQVAAAGLRVREIPVRLIYNDPSRTFGGMLDDSQQRLRHYLEVLTAETERVATAAVVPVSCDRSPETCCCLD